VAELKVTMLLSQRDSSCHKRFLVDLPICPSANDGAAFRT